MEITLEKTYTLDIMLDTSGQNQLMLGMMKSKIIVSKNPNSLLELDTLLKLSGKILNKLDVVLLAIAKIIAMLLATIIQEVIILVNSEPMFFL